MADDILDVLEELDDDDFASEEEDEATDATASSLIEVDDDAAIESDGYEMSKQEAEDITDAIRSAASATYILLARAHQHKAHLALGYSTWAEYVKEEFDMSSQRSYQLLNLQQTVAMIEAASPEGTEVKLTEAQARDIKRELPRITEIIREEVADKTPEEAEDEIARIIAEQREQMKADAKAVEAKTKKQEEEEDEARVAELDAEADRILEADAASSMTDGADDGLLEFDVEGEEGEGPVLTPEDSMNIYNFFNVIATVSTLPAPDTFVDLIPLGRAEEVNEQLLVTTAWLNRLQALWETRTGEDE